MCNKCSVISVSEFKLVNRIIVHMSELQDTKHPIKETKAAIERKAPKEIKTPFPFNSLILLFFLIFSSCFLEKKMAIFHNLSPIKTAKNQSISIGQLQIANCSKHSKKHCKIQHLYTSLYTTIRILICHFF